MPVTPTTVRLAQSLRRDLLKVTDQQTRDLVAAWARAWDEVAADLDATLLELAAQAQYGVLSRATVLRSSRLRTSLDAAARRLTRVSDDAGVRIIGDLPDIVRAAGEAQEAIIASQLPPAERDALRGWDRVDARQLDAIVQRTTERITSNLWPVSAEADAAIRRELSRGIAAGSNPRATATRMLKRTEGRFNGGLSRALTIARTETLDAHRAAAQIVQRGNADVLAGWVWLAALSSRTCPACLAMNGTEHRLDEPGPLGHANCRCTRMPLVKPWRELGIEQAEPGGRTVPDAGNWFSKQPVKTQKQILGPARYAAWKRGDYPMGQWAARKSNPDWRASYVTSPVPPSSGGRPGAVDRLAS
jgi:SPP1 gp7 family putative phage head morphogenesis protein